MGLRDAKNRPDSFEALKAEIARSGPDLSPQLRHIAQFALDHPNDVAFGTVAAIAERAGVQPSSLVRFAKSFGFDGYSQLQQVFRSRLVAGSLSYQERMRALRDDSSDRSGALLDRFVGDGIAALEHLANATDEAALREAARQLLEARGLWIAGQGRAFPVAYYLFYALTRFGLPVQLLDNVGGSDSYRAELIGAEDALLAVSFAPYAPGTVALVETLAATDTSIVAISDGPLSPVAVKAGISFEVERDVDRPFRSLVAPICLAQTLAVHIGQAAAARDSERRPRARSRRTRR